MKTRIAALASAALLGALAAASGCTVDNNASVELQLICQPSTDCSFSETCEQQYIGYPAFDRSVTRPAATAGVMSVYLQVANQLPNNEDLSVGRVNTNDAHVDEIVVEYEGAVTGEQSSGTINLIPAEGTSVVKVPLVLGTAGAAGEVLARVRLRGYYDHGARFETGEFPISIQVCTTGCVGSAGCLAGTCPPQSDGQRPLTCLD